MNADSRIRWRCRRGMKELDVMLERFLVSGYEQASFAQKEAFSGLLDLPDPELAAYLFGHATPRDPDVAELTELIARHPD